MPSEVGLNTHVAASAVRDTLDSALTNPPSASKHRPTATTPGGYNTSRQRRHIMIQRHNTTKYKARNQATTPAASLKSDEPTSGCHDFPKSSPSLSHDSKQDKDSSPRQTTGMQFSTASAEKLLVTLPIKKRASNKECLSISSHRSPPVQETSARSIPFTRGCTDEKIETGTSPEYISIDTNKKLFQTKKAEKAASLPKTGILEGLYQKDSSSRGRNVSKEKNEEDSGQSGQGLDQSNDKNTSKDNASARPLSSAQIQQRDVEDAMGTMHLLMKTLHHRQQAKLNLRARAVHSTASARQKEFEKECLKKVVKTQEEAWRVKKGAVEHVLRMRRKAELALQHAAERENEARMVIRWHKKQYLRRARLEEIHKKRKPVKEGGKTWNKYAHVNRRTSSGARPLVCGQRGEAVANRGSYRCEPAHVPIEDLINRSFRGSSGIMNNESSVGVKYLQLELKKKEGECAWLRSRVNDMEDMLHREPDRKWTNCITEPRCDKF